MTNGVREACCGTKSTLLAHTLSSDVSRQTPLLMALFGLGMNPAVVQPSVSKHFFAQSAGVLAGTSLVTFSLGRLPTGITWNSNRPGHFDDTPKNYAYTANRKSYLADHLPHLKLHQCWIQEVAFLLSSLIQACLNRQNYLGMKIWKPNVNKIVQKPNYWSRARTEMLTYVKSLLTR